MRRQETDRRKTALTDHIEGQDNEEKSASKSNSMHLDPRMISFVRMLARHAAERDFARHSEHLGKAHKPPTEKD